MKNEDNKQLMDTLKNTITPWGEIGYIVMKRTYARRLKEDDMNSKTEEFWQIVKRELDASDRQLQVGFTDEEKVRYAETRLKLLWSVAGRFQWQLNTRTVDKLGLPSLQNCAAIVIDSPIRPFTWTMDMLMLGSGVGYSIQKEHVYQLPKVKRKVKIVRDNTSDADFIVPDSREGWVKLLGKVLKAHFYSGEGFSYSTQLIRGKGAPIKGFGGTASGPEELCWGINEINKILNSRSMQKVRPIDCLDIMNIIGYIVVAGNVRRCLSSDTNVLTNNGNVPIKNIKAGDLVMVSGGSYEKVANVFKQGVQDLLRITTKEGCINCTANHRMAVASDDHGGYIWREAALLTTNDYLLRNNTEHGENTPSQILGIENAPAEETYDIEVENKHEFFANGYLTHNSAQLCVGDYDDLEFLKAKRWDLGAIPNWRSMSNNSVAAPADLDDLPQEFWDTYLQGEPYGLINLELSRKIGRTGETQYPDKDVVCYNPCVTGETELLTKDGYVRIDSLLDNTVEIWNGFEWSEVQPKITGYDQPMLRVKLSDGRQLDCTDYHKWHLKTGNAGAFKIVKALELKPDDELIDFYLPASRTENGAERLELRQLKITAIERIENAPIVYCFNEPKSHLGVFNGIITGQCAEQSLNNAETCCLAEIYLPNIGSYEELQEVLTYAYRMNKHSLALPCALKETQAIVNANMRMGIGMTGILQASKEQRSWLDKAYVWLREYDKEYSKKHNFPASIKLSTVKPAGTLSLLAGVTPGIHPSPAGPHYIRRMRMSADSPLLDVCRSHGYHVEPQKQFDGSNDKTTMVAEFPCKLPRGTPVAANFGWKEQLDNVREMQRVWSDNSVSCTVYYKKEDIEDIKAYLKEHFPEEIKTVSFLLYQGHGFAQAPYETITKAEYEEKMKNVTPIVSVEVKEEYFDLEECATGACPVK